MAQELDREETEAAGTPAAAVPGPRHLGPKFEEALRYAAQLHRRQARKGTDIPYVAHLLAVASLALEHGGDEGQAIAALLHDAVEDQGGVATLEEIRRRFGERVARLVHACSDTLDNPKPAWRGRKEAYLSRIADEPADALIVALADKLHNARSILADLRLRGDDVWQQFSGGRDGTLWYYRALVEAFGDRQLAEGESDLWRALDETVRALEAAVSDEGS